MRKILIVHTWGLGDWLFFTPVLKGIILRFPTVRFEVILGTPGSRGIVGLYPEVRIQSVCDVRRGPVGMLKAALRSLPTKYDALLFSAGVDTWKADQLARLLRADRKAALDIGGRKYTALNLLAPYDPGIHRLENNLKLLRLLGIELPDVPVPYLPLSNLPSAAPGSVIIHAGSDVRNPYKRWPAERFVAVAEGLLRVGRDVSVILGPGEEGLAVAFSHLGGRPGFRMLVGLPLIGAIREVAAHETLLNSDSGLGHIAGALGRRTVTIMGPADPATVRVYSDKSMLIRLQPELECMPCFRRGGRHGCSDRQCMTGIDVETVIAAIVG